MRTTTGWPQCQEGSEHKAGLVDLVVVGIWACPCLTQSLAELLALTPRAFVQPHSACTRHAPQPSGHPVGHAWPGRFGSESKETKRGPTIPGNKADLHTCEFSEYHFRMASDGQLQHRQCQAITFHLETAPKPVASPGAGRLRVQTVVSY